MALNKFKIKTKYEPAGDQPKAIEQLVKGIKSGQRFQTLFGVTGSGKTFTVANVIQEIQKPTLIIAHNKTLAAQLAQEYKEFFPDNEVHYFVSYYDYYQPEAYMPVTDTYIEKEAMINEEIDRLRHASTQALLTRKDVIIVASVSCIYGLGSPEEYEKVNFKIDKNLKVSRGDLIRKLIDVHYERTNADLKPGLFRAIGNKVEIVPISERFIIAVEFHEEKIIRIDKIDAITREIMESDVESYFLFPAKHFITNKDKIENAIKRIELELKEQLKKFEAEGKLLEAERLKRRTKYDLALIREVGYCNGIENYSAVFDGRLPGSKPNTLLSYFPHKEITENGQKKMVPDFLTIIDESHVTVPQIGAMFAGDESRKNTLVDHGFRLPSAKDNRPLKFAEFLEETDQTLFTTATPSKFENENSTQIVEQVIRPTGLIDPVIEIKPVTEKGSYKGQVRDFITQAKIDIKKGGRVIATTLTKKMAEDLSEFLKEEGIKAEYLHSEIKTIQRIEILSDFRRGTFDVLVGVNLLREGLDLPEVTMIGILDADKEGFLRSETSLIQIIGRAARNIDGRVILYADNSTKSLEKAISETERRRAIQLAYNKEHGITPKTVIRAIKDITEGIKSEHQKTVDTLMILNKKMLEKAPEKLLKQKEKQMNAAAKILDFETAAILRDEIKEIELLIEKKNKKEVKDEKDRLKNQKKF
jgi:excinuclease ABC subunit B